MTTDAINIFWLRNDLRTEDNKGLYYSLTTGACKTLLLFIFDPFILDKLESKEDKRVTFIAGTLKNLEQSAGCSILCSYGKPSEVFGFLAANYNIAGVYCNEDYEPYSIERDDSVERILSLKGIKLHRFKDSVVFAKNDILKGDKTPYTVYTPYANAWKRKLMEEPGQLLASFYSGALLNKLVDPANITHIQENGIVIFFRGVPELSRIGFIDTGHKVSPFVHVDPLVIDNYEETRNYPAVAMGTTGLGMQIRFGTVSIRKLVSLALNHSQVWLGELIWREFFKMILYHFPYVVDEPFKKKYSFVQWRNDPSEVERWQNGNTGYPIVDAGMRELNTTGLMHNRVRMITASFLVKHLLVDWRVGEAYFAGKLLDYDLSANNGNWQWVAGTGCDAAPYFRIFNPYEQARKFDPKNTYIKKWIPEFGTNEYPAPMCNHSEARLRALEAYKKALEL